MANRTWTDDDLRREVKGAISLQQVIRGLGLKSSGNAYRILYKRIKELDLDISHFKGQRWQEGIAPGNKRSIEDYLNNKFSIGSHALKLRLLAEGYFEHKCYSCGLSEWMGKPIPIELEHIDGQHDNNELSNLTILCPNCHAQTDTYKIRKSARA